MTRTSTVVSVPLPLLMSTIHRLVDGNELLMPTNVLTDSTNAPPPIGTVLAGQVAEARVRTALGAGSRPELTVT